MKKIILPVSLFLITINAIAQKATGKLKFEQGQTYEVSQQVKRTISQQAMGQAIDFTIDASGEHTYKVTNVTEENTTLHHQVKHAAFAFDGMGQKKSLDTKNEKDLNGQLGKPFKDMLEKSYDIIIDTGGKTLMAIPEKIVLAEGDSRMAIITNMLSEVMDIVQPPQKGTTSFFKILPDNEVAKGDTWVRSYKTGTGKEDIAYAILDINDSTIVVDFASNSTSVTKAEMMGNETTTTMNNKSKGKIILDRVTGIIKEKTFTTESNGNTEASFGTLPVTSKTTTTIVVKPVAGN